MLWVTSLESHLAYLEGPVWLHLHYTSFDFYGFAFLDGGGWMIAYSVVWYSIVLL